MLKYLVVAVVAASLAAPSFAQQTPPTPEERAARFDAADKNKDGKLDKAEWTTTLPAERAAMADQIWGRIDADGDGSVTREQYLALRMGPRPQ